jgi:hypothetical protein
MYTPERAIPSSAAFHPKDGFIGRIDVMHIPPPHTASTVSRCLAEAEKIPHQYSRPMLFSSPADQAPMSATQKISILDGPGPGASQEHPLALVLSANPGLRAPSVPRSTISGVNPTQYRASYHPIPVLRISLTEYILLYI